MDEHDIEIKVLVNAKKETIIAAEAMEKVLEANRVVAAKGKKLVEFTLKGGELQGDVSLEDLQKAIIGPSGNLRCFGARLGMLGSILTCMLNFIE